jgi:aspartate-semialdehyde dehydrogenase
VNRKLRVAVINPLSITGKEIRGRIREREFPIADVDLFDSGGGSAGALTDEAGEAAYVAALDEASLGSADVVFLCDGDETSRKLAAEAAAQGAIVVEVSDGAGDAPAVVPGVNDAELPKGVPFSARVPSASAVLLSRLLAALRAAGRISRIDVTQLEPASLRGDEALEEMLGQALGLLNFRPLPKNVFGRQMAFNVFADPDRGRGVGAELRTLLGADFPVVVTTLRGPSFHGHGFSVLAEFAEVPERAKLENAIATAPGLLLDEGEMVPGTVEAAGTDEGHVVILGQEPGRPAAVRIWMVADHLRNGPALNAIQLAETMAGLPGPSKPATKRLRRGRT